MSTPPSRSNASTKGKDAAAVAAAAAAAPEEAQQLSQPVRILNTPHAQTIRYAHPAVLVAAFAARFPAVVADPVATMSNSLPFLVVLQSAYVILCLPPAGSQSSRPARKLKPGEKKKASDGSGPNIAVTLTVALVLSAVAAMVFHAIFILFGAPFLTHHLQTFLCALHLALLGAFPVLYARGVTDRDWLEIVGVQAPFDETFGGLLGACIGAWIGAVPVPLDWDREWQKWPITILCGVYAGYTVGKLIGGTVAFGKRFG